MDGDSFNGMLRGARVFRPTKMERWIFQAAKVVRSTDWDWGFYITRGKGRGRSVCFCPTFLSCFSFNYLFPFTHTHLRSLSPEKTGRKSILNGKKFIECCVILNVTRRTSRLTSGLTDGMKNKAMFLQGFLGHGDWLWVSFRNYLAAEPYYYFFLPAER